MLEAQKGRSESERPLVHSLCGRLFLHLVDHCFERLWAVHSEVG